MLYVNPGGIPSMERSIELFRYLERHDDIERSELDSEVARLFFTYPDWSHSEHLIFLIKLYSRSAIIHVRSPHDPSEDDRAEAFMKDLTRWRDEPLMLSLTVARIGRISSVLQLAARYFAYTAFTNTELDQGSVDGWRKICLKAVLAGADLQGNFENQLDWDSPLGMAIENVMSTMWAYEIEGHMQYKLVSRFLKAWLSLLNDAGVNIPQYVLRESRLLKKVKSRLIDEVPKKRSPQTLQDLWVNWLLSGVRLKRTHRSPRWRLQWPPAASIGKLSGPRKSHILDQATSGHFQHYLHIPGAWGSPEEPDCQADSLNGLPSESVDTEQQSAPVNSMTSSTHKLGFPCTSSLFNHSVQGEAYRKLRLGKNDADALSSSADGSIYPIHEEGCKCRRCLQENDRRKRARQKTRKLLNQVSGSLDELRMDSGGGSGCGHPLPRDPPQPRDPCAV
ncbi:hypothetical protein K431DRAFT_287155 [Polychaeton citri CBS 116435]|uniref:Uncharacterized protein n=1 Tax=Polychaeton citri CBS 116435 TaxID=1314669 RepID=A0A9P4ULX4_9PEZI|nr:hypothetical protein K431DRAFT_287155 [Polychaeton citri CBS 116435]